MSIFVDSMIHLGKIARDELPGGQIEAGEWLRDANSLLEIVECGEARDIIVEKMNELYDDLKSEGFVK